MSLKRGAYFDIFQQIDGKTTGHLQCHLNNILSVFAISQVPEKLVHTSRFLDEAEGGDDVRSDSDKDRPRRGRARTTPETGTTLRVAASQA